MTDEPAPNFEELVMAARHLGPGSIAAHKITLLARIDRGEDAERLQRLVDAIDVVLGEEQQAAEEPLVMEDNDS